MFDTIKATLSSVASTFEGWIQHLPPEVQAGASEVVSSVRAVAETAIDAEVSALAGPLFAPEAVAIINEALDALAARIDADMSVRVAGIAKARDVLSGVGSAA